MVAPRRIGPFVVDVEHRDVRHEARRRSTMPVVLARLEEHTVARADYLDRTTATLGEADAFGDENGLAVWVRVPGSAGAGCEVDAARAQARRTDRRRNRVHVNGPSEPLARPCHGLDTVPSDLHVDIPHLFQLVAAADHPQAGGSSAADQPTWIGRHATDFELKVKMCADR